MRSQPFQTCVWLTTHKTYLKKVISLCQRGCHVMYCPRKRIIHGLIYSLDKKGRLLTFCLTLLCLSIFATLTELVMLPQIGPVFAIKIVEYRNRHNLYMTINDIEKVDGIGRGTFNAIRHYISID